MIGLWNVQWLNQNSQRSYPLTDFGEKTTTEDPNLRIPDDFLLALRLSVNTGVDAKVENFFIQSIVSAPVGCTVTIGYNSGTKIESAAVAYINSTGDIINCKLIGLGNFSDAVGYAAFSGSSPVLTEWLGYYSFLPTSTPIEPECIVPMLRGVSSMSIDNTGTQSDRYYGDIELVAGTNISLYASTTNDITRIVINALDTSGFNTDCSCEIHDELPCIKSIQGAHGDVTGNILFNGTDCVSISGSGNVITFNDTCAKPDCGCDELTDLSESVRELENGVATLQNLLNQLYTAFSQTNQAVTASKAGKAGCG